MSCTTHLTKKTKIINNKPNRIMANTNNKDIINNVTITSTIPPIEGRPLELKSSIELPSKDLTVNIKTDTDWFSVGATFVVGMSGALISYQLAKITKQNQKESMRATRANFRQQWQQDIRTTTANFLATAYEVHRKTNKKPDYLTSDEAHTDYAKLVRYQSTIELMLDKKQAYSRLIERNLETIIINLFTNNAGITSDMNSLLSDMRDVLEKAWQDINADIENN